MELGSRPSKRRCSDAEIDEDSIARSAKRTSRACDLCRAKKNKCDGQRPTCSTCIRSGLDCSYGTERKKRGFPTGYVRVLEALWALVFKAIPTGEQAALKLLTASSIGYDDDEKVILHSSHFGDRDSPRIIWEKSSVRAEIERMVARLETPAGVNLRDIDAKQLTLSRPAAPLTAWSVRQTPSSTEVFSGSPPMELAILSVANDPKFRNATSHLLNLSPGSNEHNRSAQAAPSDPMSVSGPELISNSALPIDAWALINIYFGFNHCWLPIVEKHDIVRILSSLQDGYVCSVSENALLFAIFAIASAQNEAPREKFHCYYLQALSAIPDLYSEVQFEHAQTLVLLAMVDMATDDWQAAYLLVGRAVRMLLLLHAQSASNTSPGLANVLSTKASTCLLLGAFALDTITSAFLNALPHLRTHDIENLIDFDENGAEEWSQWSVSNTTGPSQPCHQPVRALSTFKMYLKLLQILNDMCCTSHQQGWGSGRTDVDQWLSRLEAWKELLPKHCKLDMMGASPQTSRAYLPPVMNLHITLEAVFAYVQVQRRSLLATSADFVVHEDSPIEHLYDEVFGQYKWAGVLQFQARMVQAARPKSRFTDNTGSHALDPILELSFSAEHFISTLANQAGSHGHVEVASTLSNPVALPQGLRRDFTINLPSMSSTTPSRNLEGSAVNHFDRGQLPLTDALSGLEPSQNVPVDHTTTVGSYAGFNSVYDRSLEDYTVENLFEDLSATKDSDWNEISSQFRHNLGFTDNGFGLP